MSEKESGIRTLLGGSDEGAETTKSAAFAQIALERIGLFAAVFGFALLVVKITRVSHLNGRTSQALLSGVGPIEIVMGSLVAHFPLVLFTICLLLVWRTAGSLAIVRSVTPAHMAAASVLLFGVLLLPWPFLVVLVLAGIVRFNRPSRRAGERRRTSYYVLLAAAATLLIVDSEVWLPPEVFTTEGQPQLVGYALQEAETSTGWVVVLTEEDRSVLRIREEDISSREPCHLGREHEELETFPSLLQILLRESSALPEPPCP